LKNFGGGGHELDLHLTYFLEKITSHFWSPAATVLSIFTAAMSRLPVKLSKIVDDPDPNFPIFS
jgi:hypothetical protein